MNPSLSVDTCICTLNITGGERSFKNSGSYKILTEFHRSRSLVFKRLGVSCSLNFYTKLSRSLAFLQG